MGNYVHAPEPEILDNWPENRCNLLNSNLLSMLNSNSLQLLPAFSSGWLEIKVVIASVCMANLTDIHGVLNFKWIVGLVCDDIRGNKVWVQMS